MTRFEVTVAANAPVYKTFQVAAEDLGEAQATMMRYLAGDEGITIIGCVVDGEELSMEEQFDSATLAMKADGWSVAAIPSPEFRLVKKLDTGEVVPLGK
jgi:hypothetical protein